MSRSSKHSPNRKQLKRHHDVTRTGDTPLTSSIVIDEATDDAVLGRSMTSGVRTFDEVVGTGASWISAAIAAVARGDAEREEGRVRSWGTASDSSAGFNVTNRTSRK